MSSSDTPVAPVDPVAPVTTGVVEEVENVVKNVENVVENVVQDVETVVEDVEKIEKDVEQLLKDLVPVKKYIYGCIRDNFNPNDEWHQFTEEHFAKTEQVSKVDLRNEYMPPIYDQGQLGCCTAEGCGAAYSYQYAYEHKESFTPSQLFIYYNERVIEGTVNTDSGAQISDGIKVLNQIGVCSETLWPFDISKFTDKPPASDYQAASKNKCTTFKRIIPNVTHMKAALVAGTPVVFGFSVPQSFENIGSDGIFHVHKGDPILGGHCVLAVGFNDDMEIDGSKGAIIVRNSWGTSWGDKGYCYMPYSFANSGAISDTWSIISVT